MLLEWRARQLKKKKTNKEYATNKIGNKLRVE